jgi:hypothetical protein
VEPNAPGEIPSPLAETPPHVERVRGADRKAYWKLTCFCGKILLAPADGPAKQGRCSHCSALLLFPTEGYITTALLPVIPQRKKARKRPATEANAPVRDRHSKNDRTKPRSSASDRAADKLRPDSTRSRVPRTGLVSAWPSAGKAPRALAAFIDLTLALALAALLFVLAPWLPVHFSSNTFRVAAVLLGLWLNEGVLQWFWNGSIGKKLCVIALREETGDALSAENALLRPFVKLALLPLWPLAFFSATGQAVHDKLLGTVVLKGRG